MTIHLILNRATVNGLKRIIEDKGWEEIHGHSYIRAEYAAWLTFALRKVEDRIDWFPSGKWATIQKLQSFFETQTEWCQPTCKDILQVQTNGERK